MTKQAIKNRIKKAVKEAKQQTKNKQTEKEIFKKADKELKQALYGDLLEQTFSCGDNDWIVKEKFKGVYIVPEHNQGAYDSVVPNAPNVMLADVVSPKKDYKWKVDVRNHGEFHSFEAEDEGRIDHARRIWINGIDDPYVKPLKQLIEDELINFILNPSVVTFKGW